jgi:hypothetical protein
MPRVPRRSFLAASAAVGAACHRLLEPARADQVIPGFDQTRTDYDRTKLWKPFSDRKVRVGIVGHGVCQFGLAFDLQTHPNVELVAVSDLFPDRCADMARRAKCSKTYPSLEEMVKDDSIEAIYCATDAPAHAKHSMLCMRHGKHVATAVPAFRGDIEDAEDLLECCKASKGLVYAMFETSVFHDDLYAMEKLYRAGGTRSRAEGDKRRERSKRLPLPASAVEWIASEPIHPASDGDVIGGVAARVASRRVPADASVGPTTPKPFSWLRTITPKRPRYRDLLSENTPNGRLRVSRSAGPGGLGRDRNCSRTTLICRRSHR